MCFGFHVGASLILFGPFKKKKDFILACKPSFKEIESLFFNGKLLSILILSPNSFSLDEVTTTGG